MGVNVRSTRVRLFFLCTVFAAVLVGASAAHAALPPTMAAIGDSLSNGFAAGGSADPFRSASWSTGTSSQVESQRKRIEDAAGGRLEWVKNYAAGGTLAWQRSRPDLATQAAKVPIGTAYVTISVGSGELCSKHVNTIPELNNRVSKIPTGVRDALRVLFRRNPGARVQIMSIPNWYELWQTFNGDAGVVNTWHDAGACNLVLGPSATDSTRSQVNGKTQLANDHLADVCGEFPRCTFDGLAVWNSPWTLDELSELDRFHFSYSGNDGLADLTWPESPYFGDTGDFAQLNLRIFVNGAKKLARNRVRVSFDTFPGADASVTIRRGNRVIGRASGGANGDGDFIRKVNVSSTRGRLTIVMKAAWQGQKKTAQTAIG
jgi:hypothetical protein